MEALRGGQNMEGGDLPRIWSQGCSHPVLPWPCLHVLDEAAVSVPLDTSSHFTSAVPHAGRLNIGLCGEDVAVEGSSRKQVASEETTPPWGAIHLQQRHDWETGNMQCDSSLLITILTAFVKKSILL